MGTWKRCKVALRFKKISEVLIWKFLKIDRLVIDSCFYSDVNAILNLDFRKLTNAWEFKL